MTRFVEKRYNGSSLYQQPYKEGCMAILNEASSENVSKVNWTVAQLQEQRGAQREAWIREFDGSLTPAARKIAESILSDLFENLEKWLGDAYRSAPSQSTALDKVYSLSLPDNASQVKAWMKEAAEQEPFASWFQRFAKADEKKVDVAFQFSKVASVTYPSSLDKEFFRDLMSKVGLQVAGRLTEKLEDFQKLEGNESLRSKVEWIRSEEQPSVSSLSSSANSNSIKVSLWLEEQKQKSGWSLW